jgi:zinc finger-containing ubiquitin peptidase 1
MPQWLQKLLETDGQLQTVRGLSNSGRSFKVNAVGNHVAGVIPIITRLLRQDSSTRYAYTCDPCVQHITKMQKEGGFIWCHLKVVTLA